MKPLRGLAAEIVPFEAKLSRWRTILPGNGVLGLVYAADNFGMK
jgi:hypothetical protein